MEKGFYIKAVLTSILAAAALKLDSVGNLILLFIAAIILDYLTGIAAAIYNKDLSSVIGFRGVIKKVGEFFVIAVALLCDEVVAQACGQFGLAFSTGGAIASIVIIWLVLNELISSLENISEMNIALPPFLLKAILLLKKQAGASGDNLVPPDNDDPPK